MRFDATTYRLTDLGAPRRNALIVAALGGILSIAAFVMDAGHFYHIYLTGYVFWITIGLGAMFFTLIQHVVAAQWSIVVRRLAENTIYVLPLLVVLFIPIAVGAGTLYKWTDHALVANDHILHKKEVWLNLPFFYIRTAIYFVVWFLLARYLYGKSIKQDKTPSDSLIIRLRQVSAPGIILFALTTTLMAFDWLMSLDPHWYSTIYGVYIFTGGVIGFMAFLTLITMRLRKDGVMREAITEEHYHDYGKLLFAFTVFWAYVSFSQFFLIWYGNIPEETVFFHHRWEGSWKIISSVLPLAHFVIPFLILIVRSSKRNLSSLKLMAGWMFVMHYIDLYWNVMPNYLHDGPSVPQFALALGPMLFVGGIFMWVYWGRLEAAPIAPVGDRRLAASVRFTNA